MNCQYLARLMQISLSRPAVLVLQVYTIPLMNDMHVHNVNGVMGCEAKVLFEEAIVEQLSYIPLDQAYTVAP